MSDPDPDAQPSTSLESSLSTAMRARSERVAAMPDRADLHRREHSYRRRRSATRAALATATVAVIAVGISGLVASLDRSDTTESPANVPSSTALSAPAATSELDDENWFLTDTTQVYERTRSDGTDIIVRTADRPFADFVDVQWTAPTGSAEMCFGDSAVLFGFDVGDELSWTARGRSFIQAETPIGVITSTRDLQQPGSIDGFLHLLRTPDGTASVVVTAHGGEVADRAPAMNGYAVIDVMDSDVFGDGGELRWPRIDALGPDGAVIGSATLDEARVGLDTTPAECMPPPRPPQPLPPPGDQPANPTAAEESIRSRHALLVDRSIDGADKPDDLLTDDTGVSEALAQVDAGQYAASAAGAAYRIDDLVFVAPDHAWFRYTIDAPTGLFDNRFGQAFLVDGSWQITRDTICNDLALAGGTCEPAPDYEEPPTDPDWIAAIEEWQNTAGRYYLAAFSQDLPSLPCKEPLRC